MGVGASFRKLGTWGCLGWAAAFLPAASADETRIVSLLHTNDIHSHYRPDIHAPYLGGMARIKTLVDRLRAEADGSLLVDGGDWSEGQIYYYLGAGLESYRMMDRIGYDVAVIGNHDWLNGADVLLKVVKESGLRTTPLATNLAPNGYPRAREFREAIPEFTIREVAGARIGFFGLLTYEFIYDTFLTPMKITSPFEAGKKLSERLKKELGCDFVVAISHNSTAINRKVLEVAPALDLIVGAHDHKKYVKPVVIPRAGAASGWIVETGSWGRYLGRVQLKVTEKSDSGRSVKVELLKGELIPVDSSIPEDPAIARYIDELEGKLESRFGPIFHDRVGESETDFQRLGPESEIGDLMTDSIRELTGADLAIDHQRFIYSTLVAGPLRSADIYNAAPGVYSAETGKSWTIHTLTVKGSALQFLFNLLLSPQKLADGGEPSFSGMKLVYDSPMKLQSLTSSPDFRAFAQDVPTFMGAPVIKSMLIGGENIHPQRRYRMAFSGGMRESLIVVNQVIPGLIPLDDMTDTGVEAKEALKNHIGRHSPISALKLDYGTRAQPVSSDLAIRPAEVKVGTVTRSGALGTFPVRFMIRNYGAAASEFAPGSVKVQGHSGSGNPVIEMQPADLLPPRDLPPLPPGGAHVYEVSVTLPFNQGPQPVLLQLMRVGDEANLTNNEFLFWVNSGARTPE